MKTSLSGNRGLKGFGLVETLLTIGALSALSLGIYMVLKPTSASAQAKVEQDNLRDLSGAIEQSIGLIGSFDGVSASRVVADGLAPSRMTSGGGLVTDWGSPISVAPASINSPNDAFVVTYPSTPSDVCSRLAAAVYRQTFDIRVGGNSVMEDGSLNPSVAASECSARGNSATMEFVYHSGLVAGTAVAAPPLVLPPSNPVVGRPSSPPLGGPVGPAGPVAPVSTAPPVAPPPAAPVAPPSSTPVTTTTPPAAPPPSAPPPPTTVTACVVPPNWWKTRT